MPTDERWDGSERRSGVVTLDAVELAMRKYLDEYREGLEKMCANNVKIGFLEHLEENVHLDRDEKRQIYETINYVKGKKKLSWGFWVPVLLISITAIFNFILLVVKIKL